MKKFDILFFVELIMLTMASCSNKEGVVEITDSFIEAVHQYDELYPFSEGMAAVRKDGKFGYINTKGELVIPAKFYGVSKFSEGLACVYGEQNQIISFINTAGDVQFSTPYKISSRYFHTQQIDYGFYLTDEDVAGIYFNNGVCKIEIGDAESGYTSKYIDKEGNEIDISEDRLVSDSFSKTNDFIVFEDESINKYGIKDNDGNILVKPQYDYISNFNQGVAVVEISERSPIEFETHGEYLEALLRGEKLRETIYGYLDTKGNNTFTESDFKKLADYKAEQLVKKVRLEQQRSEERYREELEKGPEWIDGTWAFVGKIPNLLGGYINANVRIHIDRANQTIRCSKDAFCNGEYEVRNGTIYCGNTYINIDEVNHRLELGDEMFFHKVSDNSSANSSYYTSTQGSSQNLHTSFSHPTDVMAYLDGKTFQDGNTSIKVRHEAVYVNGNPISGAPRITNFTPTTATIVASSPYMGGANMNLYINASNNTITQAGDVYCLRIE